MFKIALLAVVAVTSTILLLFGRCVRNLFSKSCQISKTDAVFITGCDSGIGYSLACYCQELGMTVFAGCYKLAEGAFHLEELENVHVVPLDVTDPKSIRCAMMRVNHVLNQNEDTILKILVNNAGIMVFGEFAWHTETLIQQQINTNLIGAMNVTKAFLTQIVENKGRIINICSHCSLESLPGLSVYAASKAGLLAWNDSLRVELKKFSVPVISIIPGSYPLETNILLNQQNYAEEMKRNMSKQQWEFYESYFKKYNSYLTSLSNQKNLTKITNRCLYSMFDNAIKLVHPKPHYCYSTWRYWWYHELFRRTPTYVRDTLVLKFVNLPTWKK